MGSRSALLSAFLQELIAKVATPEATKFLKRRQHAGAGRLKEALRRFGAVVDDAEEKQFGIGDNASSVREWLTKLQHTLYLLEELLEDITVHSMDAGQNTKWLQNRIRRFLPSTKIPLAKIRPSFHQIMEQVENLLQAIGLLGLTERVTQNETVQKLPPSSFVGDQDRDHDRVHGREEEIMGILDFLLSDNGGAAGTVVGNTSVVGIVGIAGIGKTTLAQLAYNNYRVKLSFGVRAWANVSQMFSVGRLAKKILKAFTTMISLNDNLDLLRTELKEYLWGKKFLLVLDDCWVVDETNWSLLRTALEAGARGSVIIVTTRLEKVGKAMEAAYVVHLQGLSLEHCRSLFAAHAFGFGPGNLHCDPRLKQVGEEIVKKCQGLPLAAKMLGVLLHAKEDLDEWIMISLSELWEGDSNLCLPFLRLCYLDLPSSLKRCFAFLSLFPKGYEFLKKEVVLLWMAEGFLPEYGSNGLALSMEDVGVAYFDFLLARSFIQKSHNDSGAGFLMHDLVHDLASFIAGNFYLHLKMNDESVVDLDFELARHLSFGRSIKDISESIWELYGSRRYLRTFLALHLKFGPRYPLSANVMLNIVSNPQCLRILSLSGCDIVKLPASIGKLRHLQYLNLSFTRIRTLPESICELYNLQTLKLSFCQYLTHLPSKMADLNNLRHLDIKWSGIQGMSQFMGKLTSLRTLTNFVVGRHESRMEELAGLSNIRTLAISKLQNVVLSTDASSANLKGKKHLDDLLLEWTISSNHPQNDREVLENLEPPRELKKLTISAYCGTRFPDWLGDASFLNLVFLRLVGCRCFSLPPLGQLPLLKDLIIEGFDMVSHIGPEFYGITASHGPFKSLVTLQFYGMLEWKEWVPLKVEGSEFPCLQKLFVQNCPKLVRDLPQHLPSLQKLEISGCDNLAALLPTMPNSCEVLVSNCNDNWMQNVSSVVFSQAFLLGVATVEYARKVASKFSSDMTNISNAPPHFTVSVSEIEEIADEPDDQIKTSFRGDDSVYPFARRSLKVSDVPQIGEPSFSEQNPIVEHGVSEIIADTSNIRLDHDSQSSYTEARQPINIDETTQPVIQTSNIIPVTDHSEDETEILSSPDTYDQSFSFEILEVLDLQLLKSLPHQLHSLRIEGCKFLESLPDALMHKISTLRELYIIDCRSLKSFSSHGYPNTLKTLYIRNCGNLEFLPPLQTNHHNYAFLEQLCIGSSCNSLTSLPLNLFPKLRVLCVWDCPSLVSISISGFPKCLAALESLEIRDCPNLISFPAGGLPTPNLASIWFSNCRNLNKLPNFFNTLTCLQSLVLHRCPELESFPTGGLPSSLNVLSIASCDQLTPRKEWGLHNLDTLSRFEIEGGCIGLESFPEVELLPNNLNFLRVSSLLSLKTLDYKGLQHLTALETLEISCCSKLHSLPNEGLPSSLVILCIKECPLLTARFSKKAQRDWPKIIAHIPNIEIDDGVISTLQS